MAGPKALSLANGAAQLSAKSEEDRQAQKLKDYFDRTHGMDQNHNLVGGQEPEVDPNMKLPVEDPEGENARNQAYLYELTKGKSGRPLPGNGKAFKDNAKEFEKGFKQ